MTEPISKNRRGYYLKQLASINNESHQFQRSKKGIKKENKSICREARQKKKVYIQSLQRIKIAQEMEIYQLRKEIAQLKHILDLQNSKAMDKIQGNSSIGIRDLIEQYRQLITSMSLKDESRIKRSLAVLRSRFGISGRDRIKWIQQHLMRIIQLSMPMHFRVLLENCEDSKTFFGLVGGGDEMRPYRLNFSEEKKEILRQMKPKIQSAKQKYNKIFERLHSSWGELKQYGEESQRIIDEIEDKVNHPIFIGNLLMNLDNYRTLDPTVKDIYPLRYYRQLREAKAGQEDITIPHYFEEEDHQAFDMLFYDSNDFH